MSKFSAGSSALGYYYQSVRGLFLILKSLPETKLYIERFDDLEFEHGDSSKQLIQLKHRIKSQSSLSNRSVDLWKTIRIWIEEYRSQHIDFDDTIFTIMTTQKANPKSIAFYLQDSTHRDIRTAMSLLDNIAETAISSDNEKAYDLYNDLTLDEKYKLLNNIRIMDSTLNIEDTEKEIIENLSWAVRPIHMNSFYERLQGWWFDLVISHLSGESRTAISFDEVEAKVYDLSDQFKSENLPVDFRSFIPSEKEVLTAKQMIFVKQLEIICLHEKRIKKAISDYYKAFNQRSKWVREKLLFHRDLKEFEDELVDEWERHYLQIHTKYAKITDEKKLITAGRDIFDWMDLGPKIIPIKDSVKIPYLNRGSYHMLSQEKKVGWHPKFVEKLEKLLKLEDMPNGGKTKSVN